MRGFKIAILLAFCLGWWAAPMLKVSTVRADDAAWCASLAAAKALACKAAGERPDELKEPIPGYQSAGDVGGCQGMKPGDPQCWQKAALWSACAAARWKHQSNCFSAHTPEAKNHEYQAWLAAVTAAKCYACYSERMLKNWDEYIEHVNEFGAEHLDELRRECRLGCAGPSPGQIPGSSASTGTSPAAKPCKGPKPGSVAVEPCAPPSTSVTPKLQVGAKCTKVLMSAAKYLSWVGAAVTFYEASIFALDEAEGWITYYTEKNAACDMLPAAKKNKDQICAVWGQEKTKLEGALGCEIINEWSQDSCSFTGINRFTVAPGCTRDISCGEEKAITDLVQSARRASLGCAIMNRNLTRLRSACEGSSRCQPPKPPSGSEEPLVPLNPVDPRFPSWRSP